MEDASLVGQRYYQSLHDRNLDAVIGTLDRNCRAEVPGGVLDGSEAIRGWMGSFFDAFPDIEHDRGEVTVSGDTVSADLLVHGTHTRPLVTPQGTIPATNRQMKIHAQNTLQVRNGAITDLKISFDAADFMRQLGVGPAL